MDKSRFLKKTANPVRQASRFLIVVVMLITALPGIFSVTVYAQSTCTPHFFRAGVTSVIRANSGFLEVLPTGEYIYNSTAFTDDCLIKFDAKGDLIWAKKYKANIGYSDEQHRGAMDKNGNIVSSIGSAVLIITNLDGQLLTSRHLRIPHREASVIAITITAENDKIVLLRDRSSGFISGYILVRLSSDLSVVRWEKYFSEKDLALKEMELTDNQILIGGSSGTKGTILIVDAVTGQLLKERSVSLDNGADRYNATQFKKDGNGYFLLVESFNQRDKSSAVIRLDSNLNSTNSYYISPFAYEQKFKVLIDSAGNITVCASGSLSFFHFSV